MLSLWKIKGVGVLCLREGSRVQQRSSKPFVVIKTERSRSKKYSTSCALNNAARMKWEEPELLSRSFLSAEGAVGLRQSGRSLEAEPDRVNALGLKRPLQRHGQARGRHQGDDRGQS